MQSVIDDTTEAKTHLSVSATADPLPSSARAVAGHGLRP